MSEPAPEVPRSSPRQRTLKGARIVCTGSQTFDVTIRDMSEGGVKLKLGSPFAVPPTFTLVILNPNTGISDKRSCEMRRQCVEALKVFYCSSAAAARSADFRLLKTVVGTEKNWWCEP